MPTENLAPILDVRGLQVSYGGIQAVKGIDFQLFKGELVSLIGANGMALAQGEDLLLVTEFRNNLVDVYDLSMGAFGTLVAQVPYLGENPHVVRVSPDGRYAVVANYTGEVTENSTSGTIAVIDLDPDSPTYLEAVTWLVNR